MNFRHALITTGLLLVLFLALYTLNRTTGVLDRVTTNIGLEVTGVVLNPVRQLEATVADLWNGYIDLVHVREENVALQKRIQVLEAQVLAQSEDMAELRRLRELLKMPLDVSWTPLGARILAGRIGPNSQLESFTINRGYTTGAAPGTPIVTNQGLIGKVLRAAPHTATAILLTHPTSRIAIFTQKSRTPGILTGLGPNRPMEVRYMDKATKAEPGELLVTSGLDGKYPKGIPVARIHAPLKLKRVHDHTGRAIGRHEPHRGSAAFGAYGHCAPARASLPCTRVRRAAPSGLSQNEGREGRRRKKHALGWGLGHASFAKHLLVARLPLWRHHPAALRARP